MESAVPTDWHLASVVCKVLWNLSEPGTAATSASGPGPSLPSGPIGQAGPIGPSNSSGQSGPSNSSGQSGPSNSSGPIGPSGHQSSREDYHQMSSAHWFGTHNVDRLVLLLTELTDETRVRRQIHAASDASASEEQEVDRVEDAECLLDCWRDEFLPVAAPLLDRILEHSSEFEPI